MSRATSMSLFGRGPSGQKHQPFGSSPVPHMGPRDRSDKVTPLRGTPSSLADAEQFFRDRVTPFIKSYCLDCHSNKRPTEAGVNFSPALKNPGHSAFTQMWKKAIARVKAHAMPPDDGHQQQ